MYCSLALSQDVLLFKDMLWFKDSLGNRDTVYVGYAKYEKWYQVNSSYNELELNTPFDSIFEVRAIEHPDIDAKKGFLSKTIIGNCEKILFDPDSCYLGADIWLLVQAKYPPVTVYWNKSNYWNSCNQASMLSNSEVDNFWDGLPPMPWDEYKEMYNLLWQCMAIGDSMVFYPDSLHSNNVAWSIRWPYGSVLGKGNTELFGIRWHPRRILYTGSYCTPFVDVEETELDVTKNQLLIQPNPVVNNFRIQVNSLMNEQSYLQLFDSSYRKIQSWKMEKEKDYSIEQLPPGIYFLSVIDAEGKYMYQKIVKQ